MLPKHERLRAIFDEMGSVLVAFSGGIDSALVLRVARDVLGDRAVALTAVGPALPERELHEAKRIAAGMGAEHLVVDSHEIDDAAYRRNAGDRCYHCKTELYTITARMLEQLGVRWVANGTNVDDLGDHRPGLVAADEARVRSPLVEAGIAKDDVRAIARELGMDVWDKPASACLASRIPYGTEVTPERLRQVGALEAALRDLGLRQVRVRHHDQLARIEVAPEELLTAFEHRDAIVTAAKAAGFAFVALDLEGYRTGSMNALLPVLQ